MKRVAAGLSAMHGRLFWKILSGFAITFFVMVEALWLLRRTWLVFAASVPVISATCFRKPNCHSGCRKESGSSNKVMQLRSLKSSEMAKI